MVLNWGLISPSLYIISMKYLVSPHKTRAQHTFLKWEGFFSSLKFNMHSSILLVGWAGPKGFCWLAVAAVSGWCQEPGNIPEVWQGLVPQVAVPGASAARLPPCASCASPRGQHCFHSRAETAMIRTDYFSGLHYNLLVKSTWKYLMLITEIFALKGGRTLIDTLCSAIGCVFG